MKWEDFKRNKLAVGLKTRGRPLAFNSYLPKPRLPYMSERCLRTENIWQNKTAFCSKAASFSGLKAWVKSG